MKTMNEIASILQSSEQAKENVVKAIELERLKDAKAVERLLFLELHLTQIDNYIEELSHNGDTQLEYIVSAFPPSHNSVDLFLELKSFVQDSGYDVEFSLNEKSFTITWPLPQ